MSLTRSFLKGMGLTEEQVSAIIEEHVSTTDALKEQRDKYKESADNLSKVQKELDDLKKDGGSWQDKYEKEHKAFEDYKADQDAKHTASQKREAYKALLKAENVSASRIDAILKVTDLASLNLKDGKFENEAELSEGIKKEWAGFIEHSSTSGVKTQNPPSNSGGKMSKEDIMKIKDTSERQKAIADNHELFGF